MTYRENHIWQELKTPSVTPQADGGVDLHEPAWAFEHGHGYVLRFTDKDIPAVEQLLAALQAAKDGAENV